MAAMSRGLMTLVLHLQEYFLDLEAVQRSTCNRRYGLSLQPGQSEERLGLPIIAKKITKLWICKFDSSSIKKRFNNQHGCLPDNINQHFTVLRKCKTKHDCLIYEMLYIRELSPSLNVQSDSIKAKLFV